MGPRRGGSEKDRREIVVYVIGPGSMQRRRSSMNSSLLCEEPGTMGIGAALREGPP